MIDGIEHMDCILEKTHNRPRVVDRRSRLDGMIMESTYEKYLIRGSKTSSNIELMYVVHPQISDSSNLLMPFPPTVCANHKKKVRHKIIMMLHKSAHEFSGQ